MKYVVNILLFITGLSYGQLLQTTIPNEKLQARILADTLQLPFFDDFSTTVGSTPLSSNWVNNGASVTNGYSINPPSFNALTLDGLELSGKPYTFVGGATENVSIDIDGETDYITSKSLDLSLFTKDDNLGLSFFWQKGGASQNTLPDLKDGDTLRLFFFDKNQQWIKIWPIDSTEIAQMDTLTNGQPFNYEFLKIQDSSFFHSGFKFKFTTFGKVTGAWDVWHLDHIYLDKNRTTDNVQDFAFSSFNIPLFGEYYSIPTEALVNNDFELNTSGVVKVFNLSNAINFIGASSLTISHPESQTVLSQNTQSSELVKARESVDVTLEIDESTFTNGISSLLQKDTIALLTKLTLVTPDDSISTNDTLTQSIILSDYYAYDDGIAEMGIGFGEYGEFVMEFSIDGIDTLTAIDLGFLKIGHDLTNTPISIRVWKSLNGVGRSNSSERLSSLFTAVKYTDSGISRYNLEEAIIMSPGKYYVGYESSSLNPIYLGFDKNTDFVQSKGYLRRGQDDWSQEEIKNVTGTPIIHPIFGKAFSLRIATEEAAVGVKTSLNLFVFPNPASNNVQLKGNITSYKIINSIGSVVKVNSTSVEDELNTIDLEDLTNGIYQLYATDGRLEESIRFVISR